jgi:transcription initiation factor TFIID subunit 7
MNDRVPIRDRTLILRIEVPGLEARLRDKMKEVEEHQKEQQQQQSSQRSSLQQQPATPGSAGSRAGDAAGTPGTGGGGSGGGKDRYLDLEGVACEPTPARNRTLWNFRCDGATYPARLVNLPCPVELHKTHDHAVYHKSVDVAQMLIVYEDEMALEEAEFTPPEGFPSYYPSGITPPLRRVVEKRFAAREHGGRTIPPRAAIADVEGELTGLMENLARDHGGKGPHDSKGGAKGSGQQRKGAGGAAAASAQNKIPALTSATKVLVRAGESAVLLRRQRSRRVCGCPRGPFPVLVQFFFLDF